MYVFFSPFAYQMMEWGCWLSQMFNSPSLGYSLQGCSEGPKPKSLNSGMDDVSYHR